MYGLGNNPVEATDSEAATPMVLPRPANLACRATPLLLGIFGILGFFATLGGLAGHGATRTTVPPGGASQALVDLAEEVTHTCPSGYVATLLDMQNHDSDLHEQTLSLDDCALECDNDPDCVGFEQNNDADHCWITRTPHVCGQEQHDGWLSCKKGDSDECSDEATDGFLHVGTGWCRPSGCQEDDAHCHINAYYKYDSDDGECLAECTNNAQCVGYAIAAEDHLESPNLCYVYTSGGNTTAGWEESQYSNYEIAAVTGSAGVSCKKKAESELVL